MATSGQISKTYDGISNVNTVLSWTRTSYSVADNTSTISWELKMVSTGSLSAPYPLNENYTIVIDGREYTGKSGVSVGAKETRVIASGTQTINHNTDGSKSFIYNFALTRNNINFVTISAGDIAILDAIPQPAIVTIAPDFNDEENPTINYTSFLNGAASYKIEACISFTGAKDDIPYREIPIDSTSYTFNLTEEERQILRAGMPTSITSTVRFYIRTTIDNYTDWRYKTSTIYLINYEPTISPYIVDTNARTVELTGNSNNFIKYYSNAYFSTGASGNKGATIASQYITNGEQEYQIGSGTIEGITSNTFYLGATDSRGISSKSFKVVQLVPYVKLTNNIKTGALTANGALTFTIAGKYYNGSFGAKNNSLEVEYLIEEADGTAVFNTDGSGWVQLGTVTPTVDTNGNYTFTYTINGLDYSKEYTLTVNAIDELTPVQTSTKVISTIPVFDWSKTDFKFNVPVYLNKSSIPLESLVDYVVEQGTSGIWTYRKWYSGRVDLSGLLEITERACTTTLGSMFRTGVIAGNNYPFTVYDAVVTAIYDAAGYGALVWPTTEGNTTKPFSFYLIRPTSSDGIKGQVHFNVVGRWK